MKAKILYNDDEKDESGEILPFVREVSVTFTTKDFWGLDTTLSHIIAPALREFHARYIDESIVSGHPSDLTSGEYIVILDKMAWSFEQIRDEYPEHPMELNPDTGVKELMPEILKYEEKINEGLRLFGEYFRHLWE